MSPSSSGPVHCTRCRQTRCELPHLPAATRPFTPEILTRGDGLSFWFDNVDANYFALHQHSQRQVAIGYGLRGGDLIWREGKLRQTKSVCGDVIWFLGANVDHTVRLRHSAFWIVFYLDPEFEAARDVTVRSELLPLREYVRRDSLIGELGVALRRERAARSIDDRAHVFNLGALLGSCALRAHGRGTAPPRWATGLPRDVREGIHAYITAHLREPLTSPVLAQVAGMSADHFTRRLKVSTGLTAEQFVRRIRLFEARSLLETGQMTVEAVAEACGFGSHAAMSRQFKHRFGHPPSTVRRNTQGF